MNSPFFSSLNRVLLFFRRFSHPFSSSSSNVANNGGLDFLYQEFHELKSLQRVTVPSLGRTRNLEEKENKVKSVEICHQWPEWVEFMDHLLKKSFFDCGALQSSSSLCKSSKDSNFIRTACLNFARENSEMIRYLSRKDIRIIVGSGCPSLDRKVVNSGKRLRAYVGINEGEVCSSCELRGNCERAYVKSNKDEAGRTLDVIRILLTYGIDAMNESVGKKPSLDKALNESIRNLLKDIVDLSVKGYISVSEDKKSGLSSSHGMEKSQMSSLMKQGDWICPKCNFLNFAKNVRCLRCDGVLRERLARLCEEGRNHLPLKRGDWICKMCNFLNFAKNAKCLQCNEKPTNRMMNPGEWECSSCNYINFRKNYYCLKCGWKRPKAACIEDSAVESHMNNKDKVVNPSDTTFQHFQHKKSYLREGKSDFQSFSKYNFCKDNGDDKDENMRELENPTEFREFPIVGGKNELSKDPLMRELWKKEMRNKRVVQSPSFRRKNDHETSSSSTLKILGSNESSDEDDIAGWFRE